jgi:hypothetical protein
MSARGDLEHNMGSKPFCVPSFLQFTKFIFARAEGKHVERSAQDPITSPDICVKNVSVHASQIQCRSPPIYTGKNIVTWHPLLYNGSLGMYLQQQIQNWHTLLWRFDLVQKVFSVSKESRKVSTNLNKQPKFSMETGSYVSGHADKHAGKDRGAAAASDTSGGSGRSCHNKTQDPCSLNPTWTETTGRSVCL